MSLNETKAYAEFQRVLSQIGLQVEPVGSNISLPSLADRHLIVLGGPAANKIHADIWSALGTKVPFQLDPDQFVLRAVPRDYVPETDSTGQVIRDFGVIAKQRSPVNAERAILLVAGCHGFATEACVAMLTQRPHLQELARLTKGHDFAAVVEVVLANRQLVSVRVAECVVLPS